MPNNKFFLNIPEIKTAGLINYQTLKTGLSNQSYKLETQDGSWVIRINNKQLPAVDRFIEAEILKLIKPLDISSEVICNNPAAGYLITRFINEPVWTLTDCQNPKLQQKLLKIMEQIHSIKYQNLKTHLKKRLTLYLTNSTLKHNEQFMQKYHQCMEQLQQSNFWQLQNQLIHYDLNPNNIIGHKNPKIIDWEFAGMGNPLFDKFIFQYYVNRKKLNTTNPVRNLVVLMMDLWSNQSVIGQSTA